MMSQVLPSILFWFFFLPFRLYLLWINYKGRFRYNLWERSPLWRTLDEKVGVFSLVLDFIFSLVIVFVFSSLIISGAKVPTETAFSFVLFGATGWTFMNMAFDKISISRFEENCLQCKHKRECYDFHTKNCVSKPVTQLSKSAMLYAEKLNKGKKERKQLNH